jgi:outer membrane lipoprotein-sorting protein
VNVDDGQDLLCSCAISAELCSKAYIQPDGVAITFQQLNSNRLPAGCRVLPPALPSDTIRPIDLVIDCLNKGVVIMRKCQILSFLSILALCGGYARGENIEDVKKKIHQKVNSYKTLQYKTKTTTNMQSEQVSMKSDTSQAIACMKKGDKVLSRIESQTKGESSFSGQTQKLDSNTLSICDGNYAYDYTEQMGMKNASKRKVDKTTMFNPFDVENSFKIMEQNYTIKLNPDETVDGKPCWVVEFAVKSGPQNAGKTISYYDKSTCIGIKSVNYDDKGKLSGSSTITDIKIDQPISPDRFVFKAPAGVEVVDQSDLFKKTGG